MPDTTALVLVENEVTVGGEYDFWADDTGVQYHYPNQYRNRVRPGRQFVYYRGVRRASGPRGDAEYFGTGLIGDVWPDPEQRPDTPAAKRRWLCSIEHFVRFERPVPAKLDGTSFERMSSQLGWRTGVREIPSKTLEAILHAAKLGPPPPTDVPPVTTQSIGLVEDLAELLLARPRTGDSRGTGSCFLRSDRAAEIGAHGEEVVFNWLQRNLPEESKRSLTWVSRRGETPGWDMEYSSSGRRIAIEVKATNLSRFASIPLTSNEWVAARENRESYAIALVVNVMSRRPRIAMLWNPYGAHEAGFLAIEPVGYALIPVAGTAPHVEDVAPTSPLPPSLAR